MSVCWTEYYGMNKGMSPGSGSVWWCNNGVFWFFLPVLVKKAEAWWCLCSVHLLASRRADTWSCCTNRTHRDDVPSKAGSDVTSDTLVSNSKNREVWYKRSIVWPLLPLQGYLQILQNWAGPSEERRCFRINIFMDKMVGRLLPLVTDEHFSCLKSIKREEKNCPVHDLVSKDV